MFATIMPANSLAATFLSKEDYCHFIEKNKGSEYQKDSDLFKGAIFAFYPIAYRAEQMKYENGFFEEIEIKFEELTDIIPDAIDDILTSLQDIPYFAQDIKNEIVDLKPRFRSNTGEVYQSDPSSRFIDNISSFVKMLSEKNKGEMLKEHIKENRESLKEMANILQYFLDEIRIFTYGIIEITDLAIMNLSKAYHISHFIETFYAPNISPAGEGYLPSVVQDFTSGVETFRKLIVEKFYPNKTIYTEIPFYSINHDNLLLSDSDYSNQFALSEPIIKSKLKSAKKYQNKSETEFFFNDSQYSGKINVDEYWKELWTGAAIGGVAGAAIGGGAGAVAGGGAGAVAGGGGAGAVIGAVIGAVAGGVAGAAIGASNPCEKEHNTSNVNEFKPKYCGVAKYNHAIPGDIALTDKLIKNINKFLLTYVDLLMAIEELDILLYSNPSLTATAIQETIKKLSAYSGQFGIHEQKMMVNDIKRAVKASQKVRSLFSILDNTLNKIHNEIISQRSDQFKYKTALKDLIKNSFLAKQSCENFITEFNTKYNQITNNNKYSTDRKETLVKNLLKSSLYKKIITYSALAEKSLSKMCSIDAEKFGANLYNRGDAEVETPQRNEIISLHNNLNRYMNISSDSLNNNCVIFKQSNEFSSIEDVDGLDFNLYPELNHYPYVAQSLYKKIIDLVNDIQ